MLTDLRVYLDMGSSFLVAVCQWQFTSSNAISLQFPEIVEFLEAVYAWVLRLCMIFRDISIRLHLIAVCRFGWSLVGNYL